MLRRLLSLSLATFAVGTDGFIIAGLLPAISQDLDISLPVAGQLVTVFALTFAFSAPVLGAVTSGLDRRTALIWALVVFALGNAGTAIATSYGAALVARILAALGAGIVTSGACSIAVAFAPPEQRGRALAVVMAGLSAATALGLPLGILVGGSNWRIALWAVAGLGLVAAMGIAAISPKLVLPTSTFADRLAPARQLSVFLVLLTTVGILAGNYLLFTYIATATKIATDASPKNLSIVLLIWGIGVLAGTILSGFLCDHFRQKAIIILVLTVTITLLVISPWAFRDFGGTITWMGLWGICVGLPVVPQQHRLTSGTIAAAPIMLGLNSAAIYIGIAVGSGLGAVSQIWVKPSDLGLPAAAVLLLPFTILVMSRDMPIKTDSGTE